MALSGCEGGGGCGSVGAALPGQECLGVRLKKRSDNAEEMAMAVATVTVMTTTVMVTEVMMKMTMAVVVAAASAMVATAVAGGHIQQLPTFTSSSLGCCILQLNRGSSSTTTSIPTMAPK